MKHCISLGSVIPMLTRELSIGPVSESMVPVTRVRIHAAYDSDDRRRLGWRRRALPTLERGRTVVRGTGAFLIVHLVTVPAVSGQRTCGQSVTHFRVDSALRMTRRSFGSV